MACSSLEEWRRIRPQFRRLRRRRTEVLFEALEPRLLLSADTLLDTLVAEYLADPTITPAIESTIVAGLDALPDKLRRGPVFLGSAVPNTALAKQPSSANWGPTTGRDRRQAYTCAGQKPYRPTVENA